MEKFITYENLRYFAYSNGHICQMPPRGIVMDFWGMNSTGMYHEDTETGMFFARQGILYLIPYYNPWAFCNKQTVSLIDEILDVVTARFGALPLVFMGNSMGGLTALSCTVLSRHKCAACLANCPACDMADHIFERPDLPHALYSAFSGYDGTLEEAMLTVSPLHLVDRMPDIPYTVFCGMEDPVVNKAKHSDAFVRAMQKSHRITYYEIPGMGHCKMPEDVKKTYLQLAADAILHP